MRANVSRGMRRTMRLRTSASGERDELRDGPANMLRDFLRRLRRAGEEGASLVEFAMVLPLMMIVLTGGASFSMALYNLQQLGNATASTSQLLAAEAGLITDPCASTVSSVTASLPNWTASNLTYTVTITDSSGTAHSYGPTKGSTFSCTAGSTEMDTNEPVSVTVNYSYSWFPILSFSPSSNLVSTESALME
jgi:Flp pilus assembly protein TadG